jgi:hypothetical protein
MSAIKRRAVYKIILILCILTGLYAISGRLFYYIGQFLIYDDPPQKSDVAVILEDGLEYYPRLIEGAFIYKNGLVTRIIINGNRKTDTIRELEKMGFGHAVHGMKTVCESLRCWVSRALMS